jgi:hypothetical protein
MKSLSSENSVSASLVNAGNPYDLALGFTLEGLVHFLNASGETHLPIVAEARGKREDNNLEQSFYRMMACGTGAVTGARQG